MKKNGKRFHLVFFKISSGQIALSSSMGHSFHWLFVHSRMTLLTIQEESLHTPSVQLLYMTIIVEFVTFVHDNRILWNWKISQQAESYFLEMQYMFGDLAFENSWFLVSAFKKPIPHCPGSTSCLMTTSVLYELCRSTLTES